MENICNTLPFGYTKSLIEGKWKMDILFNVWKRETLRYNELQKILDGVTHKMLSTQLKELVNDGLLIRTEYTQIPPKVEYSLSEIGKKFAPVLESIKIWGLEYISYMQAK